MYWVAPRLTSQSHRVFQDAKIRACAILSPCCRIHLHAPLNTPYWHHTTLRRGELTSKMPKRAQEQHENDDGFVEDAPRTKKAKNAGANTSKKAAISPLIRVDDEGNDYWEVSN